MSEYTTWEMSPGGWRRLCPPVGGVWAGLALHAVATRWPAALPAALTDRLLLGALAFAGLWCAGGFLASAAGSVLERLWLARRADPGRLPGPTRAARRWAALDARVHAVYGLDVVSTWPRLWLLLAEQVRAELRTAAAAWQIACVWGGWALLFALLGVLWWPGLVAAVLLALWARSAGLRSLDYRATLLESAYDLYGVDLARQLGVQLPPSGRLDFVRGQEITARLRKGS